MAENTPTPDGVILSNSAFKRTESAVKKVEMQTLGFPGFNGEGPIKYWAAKIDADKGGGFYTATQTETDENGQSTDIDVNLALTWADKELREVNGITGLAVGTVIRVEARYADEGKFIWVFDSGVGAATAFAKTDRSNTLLNNKIVFRNDPIFNGAATNPGIPLLLGSQGYGPRVWAGMEDVGSFDIQRSYMWLNRINQLGISLLQAHDNGDLANTNANLLWIRLVDSATKLGKQYKHGVIPQGLEGNVDWMFPGEVTGYYQVNKVKADALPAGAMTVAQFISVLDHAYSDKMGHKYKVGPNYGDDDSSNDPQDETATSKLTLTVDQSDYPAFPSALSLFNFQIGQETLITTGAGVNTAVFNGTDKLLYTLEASDTNNILGSNKANFSTPNSFTADATNYDAAKNGNDDNIFSTLSKTFNVDLIYTAKLIETGVQATDTLTPDTIYVQGVNINGGADVTSGVAFDVDVELLDAAGGVRYSRFDLLGEYTLFIELFYESDNTAIETKSAAIAADTPSAGKSGVSISFTVVIPDSRKTDAEQICCNAFLHWTSNANAMPGQLGITNVEGIDILCEGIAGAVAVTSSVDTGVTEFPIDPFDVEGNSGFLYAIFDVNIPINYTILVGGLPTANYDANEAIIELRSNGVGVRWTDQTGDFSTQDLGAGTNDFSMPSIINPDGTMTAIQIRGIDGAFHTNGDVITLTVTVGGVPIAETTFTFNDGLFEWSDPFESGGAINATRWNPNNNNGTNTEVGGILEQTLSGVAGDAIIENKMPDITNFTTWFASAEYTEIGPNVNGLSQLLRIVTGAVSNTYESGYELDTAFPIGQQQRYFARVNAVDIVNVSDTSTDATPSIELGNFTADDKYNDLEQNSASTTGQIFLSRYTIVTSTGSESIDIGNESLDMSVASNQDVNINNNIQIPASNNWEMIIDFDPDTIPISVSVGALQAHFRVDIGGLFFVVVVGNFQSPRAYGLDMQTSAGPNKGFTSETKANIQLKLTGVSGTITGFYGATSFVFAGTHTGAVDMSYRLISFSGGPAGACKWSNFNVISGGTSLVEKRILFNLGTRLKAVSADPGQDVTEADLEMDSPAVATYTSKCKEFIIKKNGLPYSTI